MSTTSLGMTPLGVTIARKQLEEKDLLGKHQQVKKKTAHKQPHKQQPQKVATKTLDTKHSNKHNNKHNTNTKPKNASWMALVEGVTLYGLCLIVPSIVGMMMRVLDVQQDRTQWLVWMWHDVQQAICQRSEWICWNVFGILPRQQEPLTFYQHFASDTYHYKWDILVVCVLTLVMALCRVLLVHWLVPNHLGPQQLEALVRCKSIHLLSSEYKQSLTPRAETPRSIISWETLQQQQQHQLVDDKDKHHLQLPSFPPMVPQWNDIMDDYDGTTTSKNRYSSTSTSRSSSGRRKQDATLKHWSEIVVQSKQISTSPFNNTTTNNNNDADLLGHSRMTTTPTKQQQQQQQQPIKLELTQKMGGFLQSCAPNDDDDEQDVALADDSDHGLLGQDDSDDDNDNNNDNREAVPFVMYQTPTRTSASQYQESQQQQQQRQQHLSPVQIPLWPPPLQHVGTPNNNNNQNTEEPEDFGWKRRGSAASLAAAAAAAVQEEEEEDHDHIIMMDGAHDPLLGSETFLYDDTVIHNELSNNDNDIDNNSAANGSGSSSTRRRRQPQRLFAAPRYATAVFRLLYCTISCTMAWYLFRDADFWPPYVGGHGQTARCWDLSGSLALAKHLDSDFDHRNTVLRRFFLVQASYHLHSGAFHVFSVVLLHFLKQRGDSTNNNNNNGAVKKKTVAPLLRSLIHPRALLQHTLSLFFLSVSYVFSSLRRLGAIGMFALDMSSWALHLLQTCLNAPNDSFLSQPTVIRSVWALLVIPSFLYFRFWVWPLVGYSAMVESEQWLAQLESTLVPGSALWFRRTFQVWMALWIGFHAIHFKRLVFHPHIQRINNSNTIISMGGGGKEGTDNVQPQARK